MTNADTQIWDDEFSRFQKAVNIIFVIDHGGRAGNVFFQTIFDQHTEVLACPVMNYLYSYHLTKLGDETELDSAQAHAVFTTETYFRLVYQEESDEVLAGLARFGCPDGGHIDRACVRRVFDHLVERHPKVSRRDLILYAFFSLAKGRGRDTSKIKYIMCPDAISLRKETVLGGFSGRVVDIVVDDFPKARLFHLVRDPRAGFASSVHQFINQLGNMYGIKPGNFLGRLGRLLRQEFDWDCVFVFGFWLIYFRQTYITIMRKRADYPRLFQTVRNEDLNLDFVKSMQQMSDDLGITMADQWTDQFVPKILDRPWGGTGAYNSRTQTFTNGLLANDSENLARIATGPNAHVTQRWRSRLRPSEIKILDQLLWLELQRFDYTPEHPRQSRKPASLWQMFLAPMSGELPTPSWIWHGWRSSPGEFLHRLFYTLTFPVFFIAARWAFISYAERTKLFSEARDGL